MEVYKYKDYEEYKAVQTAANKHTIDWSWIKESDVECIADQILHRIPRLSFGLCHGTRQGKEQEWFRKYLRINVLGTDISDTAIQFPDTIEWDFHDVKREWIGTVDFVYSNSLDHSYDPSMCLSQWMRCLKLGGYCILHWCEGHLKSTKRDPFGAACEEYVDTEYVSFLLKKLDARQADRPEYGKESEEDREWLEGFAVGNGLDICCGDYAIGDSLGVDELRTRLAADYPGRGDALAFQGSDELDFIVTNYLEAMPAPLLAFNEWYRCLKDGGVLALVCMDANAYANNVKNPLGVLSNRRRYNTYTKITLSQYLYRAGFTEIKIEEIGKTRLRASAVKKRYAQ